MNNGLMRFAHSIIKVLANQKLLIKLRGICFVDGNCCPLLIVHCYLLINLNPPGRIQVYLPAGSREPCK